MDSKKPALPPIEQQSEELSYMVMPQESNLSLQTAPPSNPSRKKWLLYFIIGLIILVAAAGVGFYIWKSGKSGSKQSITLAQKLPPSMVSKYFNKEVCDDKAVCGDEADPDLDGLSNYEEFRRNTDLKKPDTDSDGLADGDEANIYKTDPTEKYTDKRSVVAENNFTDSHQIKNGYDPLTPGLKFTDTRNQQIADDIAKYGLHEPSIESLKIEAPTQ
ncbi:MAG: hypothetical protein HY336_02285 [Candidatus Doudnabacteria bacterium]|nr:hypothetical protein [Candidatus Doudnabacteria bacterium]